MKSKSFRPRLVYFAALALCIQVIVGAVLWVMPVALAQIRASEPAKTTTDRQERPDAVKAGESEKRTGSPAPSLDSEKSLVSAIRFLTSKTYTRVMVDLSREARYESRQLKEDTSKGLPARIYIDIFGAKLAMESKEAVQVQDGLLRQVRAGQFSSEVVRVVLDMNSLMAHNIFLLPDPYRLVIDIQGQGHGEAAASVDKARPVAPLAKGKKAPAPRIQKIVLDPGHGGKDPGAIGVGGIREKDIVLSVAKKLARKLRRDMGVEVMLTRKEDTHLRLEERTAIANAQKADLFISLHTNASHNGETRGLETYYLDNTDDEAARKLAARENGISLTRVSDLQFILADMVQNLKLEDSITLAHRLHTSLVSGISGKHSEVKDLGVKKAQFFVLVGAHMPSVLVEMFFITNKIEGRAMSQEKYQNSVVDALFDGIQKYNQSMAAVKTL